MFQRNTQQIKTLELHLFDESNLLPLKKHFLNILVSGLLCVLKN